jgi:hypothetical protein
MAAIERKESPPPLPPRPYDACGYCNNLLLSSKTLYKERCVFCKRFICDACFKDKVAQTIHFESRAADHKIFRFLCYDCAQTHTFETSIKQTPCFQFRAAVVARFPTPITDVRDIRR